MDESISAAVAKALLRDGVKAVTAKDVDNLGIPDMEQLEYAKKHGYVFITHDDDFLKLHKNVQHNGIVYVHQKKI
jgi:predicted nuclease of predicted toxin-antitoxin system